MTETMPGGRQRSSSEGNLLDENGEEINYVPQRLSPLHRNVSRSVGVQLADRSEYIESVAEREGFSTLDRKKKYKRPSFKAVKNTVMKMVRRTVTSSNNNDTNNSDNSSYNVKAIVTPTLRRRKQENPGTGELSNRQVLNRDNELQEELDNNGDANYGSLGRHTRRIIKLKGGITPGTVGLRNHGNTCFMNAILQCLSNTDVLTEYFVTEQYKADTKHNKNNSKKFGTKGEVLEQIAYLVRSLWTNRYTPEISNHFKSVVGKYNNQYQGYSQHDAQEFLLWLLDKIHEDLNTAPRKKYKAVKNTSLRADEDLAEEAMAHSKSFVCDLFQALYRSSLTCLNCDRQSNTFDPYLCISLPLPQKLLRPVYVTIVYADTQHQQVKIGLQRNIHDSIDDLRQALASNTGIPESRLVLSQVYDDGFRNTYGNHQPLSDLPESEAVYAFEMLPRTDFIQICFVNVEKLNNPSRCYRFCSPQVMQIPRDLNFKELQTQILRHMGEHVRDGVLAQPQKLTVLFRLRVVDGIPGKCYLNHEVDMPLYMQTVDRALSFHGKGYGPRHLKLVVEWDTSAKQCIIADDEDRLEEHASVHQVRQAQQQPVGASLDECFQLYTQEEKLCGEDAWLCPHCKKQQQGTIKKLGLWSLPDVFVIHLKRFKQTGMKRNKLDTLVNFPVNGLNMSPHMVKRTINNNTKFYPPSPAEKSLYMGHGSSNKHMALLGGSEEELYDLFAVCNHYGNMCGGHYTAYCKNPVDERWYSFDDSKVNSLSETDVVTRSAYLLFYQRRSRSTHSSEELHQGNHWVYKLDGLVDTSLLDPYVSPPPSPSKSRSTRTAASPGTGRRKTPGTPTSPRAQQPPPTSPRIQRQYSMPTPSHRQQQQPSSTAHNQQQLSLCSRAGDGERTAPKPTTPKSPPKSSENWPNNNNATNTYTSAPTSRYPTEHQQLPPNHSVTFNVEQRPSPAERPTQLYVSLPQEPSAGRRPHSGSSPSDKHSMSHQGSRPRDPPKSPFSPRAEEMARRGNGNVETVSEEQLPGYRSTPRSRSHDILRPDEAYQKHGGYSNPKYHTIGRLEKHRADKDLPYSGPASMPHVMPHTSLDNQHVKRTANYTSVISPQPFVGETQSLGRYENADSKSQVMRYQPQRHYAYLRYAQRPTRPVAEQPTSAAFLKESSV